MIVPFTKGAKSSPQNQPSEAMMLMALAHMKGLDRIPDASQRSKLKPGAQAQPQPSPEPQPVDPNG